MKSVGTPIDRVDGKQKVTGAAVYAADTPVARVLHAVIVTSSIGRGTINAIDDAAAVKAPGVVAVITPANAPRLPQHKPKTPQDRVLQLLQDLEIHYQDQPIAVVVADTLEHAQGGAALVRATYGSSAVVAALERALGDAYTPKQAGPAGSADSTRGDLATGLAAGDKRIERTYTTPIENHNPMEPHATIAVWQGDSALTLYDATQGIFGVRKRLAEMFGLPPQQVRVIDRFVGGGFGCKGSPWSHVGLAALAAKAVGRPVKLVVTRQQMFSLVGHRPQTQQHVTLAAKRDGTLTAMRHDVISETSRFDEFLEPSAVATRMLYACDNVATSHKLVRLDIPTPTFMRAPGESSGLFALESAMDELAVELAMDPVALRLKNYADTDGHEKKPYSSKSLRACYTQAAEKFGWHKRTAAPRSMKRGDLLVGWGMASATYPSRQPAASARVELRTDGTALVQVGTQDLGTGTYTVMTQVAADALGLPADKVTFELGDTAFPEGWVSGGSTTAASVGSAVKMACLQAVEKLAAAKLAGQSKVVVELKTEEFPARKNYSTHAFGAAFAEVEVDEELAHVRVRRIVGAYAAGTILNPKTARSQLLGGLVWAVGMTLHERTARDPQTARAVTRDLADYHVPVNADIPDLDVIFVSEDDPYVNPIGVKGIGEIGITGATAAIANAIFHATGKRVRELPITLDRLLEVT